MIKKACIFLCFPLLLAACGKGPAKEDQAKIVSLAESGIYNEELVNRYREAISEDQKRDGKKKFLEALDAYRNAGDLLLGKKLFTESLLISPDAQTYYELGNVMLDLEEYNAALLSYEMAEAMDYQPVSKILYNMACAYSLSGNTDKALEYISFAIESGYHNIPHLLNDPDLQKARMSIDFNAIFEEATVGAADPEESLFALYISNFKSVSLPYSLTTGQTQDLEKFVSIAYDFEDFIPGLRDEEFSRDVGSVYYYMTHIRQPDTNFTVVMYACTEMWNEFNPAGCYIHTYDKKGNTIDQVLIGGQLYIGDLISEFTIDKDLGIVVKSYEQQWEKDPGEFGYEKNKLISSELSQTTNYQITPEGRIIDKNSLMGWMRDKLKVKG